MTELHLAGHLHCFVMQILPFWNVHWQTVRKRLCLCHLSFLFGFRIKHIRLYLRRHSVCSFSAVKLTFPLYLTLLSSWLWGKGSCRERVTPLVKSCRSPGPTPSTKLKQPETEALEHFFHQNQRTGQLLILENTAKLMKTRWKYTFKQNFFIRGQHRL